MNLNSEESSINMLSQLNELRNAWQHFYPDRAEGGLLALSGFEHQFLLTLGKIVHLWRESTEPERNDLKTVQRILAEAISDITESGITITFTQVKRTLSASGVSKALDELWEIFNLASEKTPDLVPHLRFVISGKFIDDENPEQVIQGWGTRAKRDQLQKLGVFKNYLNHEIVLDPRAELRTALQTLGRDEDVETTISRWLGYLLQLGSGVCPESINTFIWKELLHDKSLKAFQATISRLLSLSRYRLCAIQDTLGEHITLPIEKLSDLQKSVLERNIVLLVGPSGSGKSALCKVGIQQHFKQHFDCLFLHASDIESFTESSDVIACRGLRRLDELLMAGIIHKPVLLIIDDLSDVDKQHTENILNLLKNTLSSEICPDVHFILITHSEARDRINEKISARFGNNYVCSNIELEQLPIKEINEFKNFPVNIISLIDRHYEFGPALNLKLVDWLIRSEQNTNLDISTFGSDLDLLTWFWNAHVQNGHCFSNSGRTLIKIARELANRFTPDLPNYFDDTIGNEALQMLRQRDCIRITDERIAVTHRFVGDCARFHDLRANRRELKTEHLVERLKNPLWVQPIRWFSQHLVVDSDENETWQELIGEALKGQHLQLLDLLLDGAILSKHPGNVLQKCPNENLSFVIERLISRLLAIATEPYSFQVNESPSTPLRTRIAIKEQTTGIPKADLWKPVWHWLLSQSQEIIIGESCIFFRAAEAWLNWSVHAESFPLRSEVASFTLDLAWRILLPDPDPESRSLSADELENFLKLRQQVELPPSNINRRKRYYLGDFQSNAFSCIVFALKIIPQLSACFLRALAGREIVPANKLEPTEISNFLSRPGVGILESPHPKGPLGKVNHQFRGFMLKNGGLYLNCVIRVAPTLGTELFLALTIKPPDYRYEFEDGYDALEDDYGTEGSDDIDVCTFKFHPLLSLLEIHEEEAIDAVNTLCQIASQHRYKTCKDLESKRNQLEDNSDYKRISDLDESDPYEITLSINNIDKQFQGQRKALYWHRNYPLSPKIINCLLMTLEGWLYSRPNRTHLEHSISIILSRSNTVAVIGVLVTLAKCDWMLLSGALLPLASSLQLLIWLKFEKIDHGQNYGFDRFHASMKLQKEEQQELLGFHQLSHREIDLQKIILHFFINEVISFEEQSKILINWSNCQLLSISQNNKSRALRIQAYFNKINWQQGIDENGKQIFRFIGTLPENPKESAEAKAASWNLQHYQVLMTCRQILDGERTKTAEQGKHCLNFITDDVQFNLLKNNLEPQAFNNTFWAIIAIILEPPLTDLDDDIEVELISCSREHPTLAKALIQEEFREPLR